MYSPRNDRVLRDPVGAREAATKVQGAMVILRRVDYSAQPWLLCGNPLGTHGTNGILTLAQCRLSNRVFIWFFAKCAKWPGCYWV